MKSSLTASRIEPCSIGDERYFDFWPELTYAEKFRLHTDGLAALTPDIPVDYVHMPVTVDPDAAFFTPLRDLDIGDTKVFLGLVHHEDGLEGSRRRIELAQQSLPSFGVAAVCGYGREDPAQLGDVFELLRASARLLDT